MPDIGELGRGLLKGALSATEKAAEEVKDAAEAASRRIGGPDDVKVEPKAADDPLVTKPEEVRATEPEPDPTPATADEPPRADEPIRADEPEDHAAEPPRADDSADHADESE